MTSTKQGNLAAFSTRTVDELTIGDERSFRHVAVYGELKDVLQRAKYPFRVLPPGKSTRADRALLLNLTYWGADSGGDVLVEEALEADVVAHAAWHHLAARALPAEGQRPTPDSLFLGEAIASAFDVYLVGRLLGHAPNSSFLETQVPAMADAAESAGLDEDGFEALIEGIADDPDQAFEDLRALLFDATRALYASATVEEGYAALAAFDDRRFAPLLHRYELSNWVLYARAHGKSGTHDWSGTNVASASDAGHDSRALVIDKALRHETESLEWLRREWVVPALREKAP